MGFKLGFGLRVRFTPAAGFTFGLENKTKTRTKIKTRSRTRIGIMIGIMIGIR